MQPKTIPIFPLDLVLFPRQDLSLRIFEPRYKQLVDDCMLGDRQFGACLIDPATRVSGWDAPRPVGTIAKITQCKDVGMDGMQLHIETTGRNPFRIKEIIEPAVPQPADYDPLSPDGHAKFSAAYAKTDMQKRMYIQAVIETIPEIDEGVSLATWEGLVELWKKKVISQALPQTVEPHALDHVLQQYYLATDTPPSTDYVYSLAALGAKDPGELQPLLEATTADELVRKVEDLLIAV